MLSKPARVIVDTLLPAEAHPDLKYGIFDAGFEAFWIDFDRSALPSLRLGFRAALIAAVWITPLLIRRPPPLMIYNRLTRERALAAMESSRYYILRQLFVVLKQTVCFCYGADPDVREVIGYSLHHDDPHRQVVP